MIGETLEPILGIVSNSSRFIGECRFEIDQLKPKIEDACQIIQKSRKKISLLEDSYKLIKDFEGDIKLFDANMRKDIARVDNNIEKLGTQFKASKQD
jgi:hypothetical protein